MAINVISKPFRGEIENARSRLALGAMRRINITSRLNEVSRTLPISSRTVRGELEQLFMRGRIAGAILVGVVSLPANAADLSSGGNVAGGYPCIRHTLRGLNP